MLFGLGENPTFIALIFDKEKYVVDILFIMTESDDIEPDFGKSENLAYMRFDVFEEAERFYHGAKNPSYIDELVSNHLKSKGN